MYHVLFALILTYLCLIWLKHLYKESYLNSKLYIGLLSNSLDELSDVMCSSLGISEIIEFFAFHTKLLEMAMLASKDLRATKKLHLVGIHLMITESRV